MERKFQALIEAHDDIAAKNYDDEPDIFPIEAPIPEIFHNNNTGQDAIRMVTIRKTDGESLVSSTKYLYRFPSPSFP